jgi:hypothetical protein
MNRFETEQPCGCLLARNYCPVTVSVPAAPETQERDALGLCGVAEAFSRSEIVTVQGGDGSPPVGSTCALVTPTSVLGMATATIHLSDPRVL